MPKRVWQIETIVNFCSDMAKGLMLGAIVGQWSIPDIELPIRILMSANWFILALLSLFFAVFLAGYEQR